MSTRARAIAQTVLRAWFNDPDGFNRQDKSLTAAEKAIDTLLSEIALTPSINEAEEKIQKKRIITWESVDEQGNVSAFASIDFRSKDSK